jgi:hypothetical protein
VRPIDLGESFRFFSMPSHKFITREIIDAYDLGIGDETFLVGRLITHAGGQRNTPIVRFGNVSLMADPSEPVKCEGYEQEGFLVECRSLSGFSGSPVFISTNRNYHGEGAARVVKHRQAEMNYEEPPEIPGQMHPQIKVVNMSGTFGPWLLGIDWGHIPLWKKVCQVGDQGTVDTETETHLRMEAATGIACVLPAWHILRTINSEELIKERKESEQRLKKQSITFLPPLTLPANT